MEIPASLRRWFVVHAAVDLSIALPLLIAPETLLRTLGWASVDSITARLVGAALLAIGVQSWACRAASVETYRVMLNLKLVWSSAAIAGLLIAIGTTPPPAIWVFLALFIAFFGVWFYYRIRIKQIGRMHDLPDDDDGKADNDDGDGDGDDDDDDPAPKTN